MFINKFFRFSFYSAAAIVGTASLSLAYAQEVEELVVSGIRGSLKDAMNIKRNADAVVDAISAEDVGKFPDKNVAESLSRMTGIGVSREFGEGEKITIRGADPSRNRTLLNGQSIATADWFILDQPVRSFNYTLLPSALVSSLEVHKSPVASMDEGSIGGTVILRTRRPLELDAHTFNASVEALIGDVSDETDPQIALQYSWKDDSNRFGLLVSVINQDRTLVREGLEVLGWNFDEPTNRYAPSVVGAPRFEQLRERETVFLSAQFAPTSNLDFTLNYLDSDMQADNHNQNWLVFTGNDYAAANILNPVFAGNNLVGGVVAASARNPEYNFINRESFTQTESIDLDINYELDSLVIHAQLGTTEAKGGTFNEASYSAGGPGGYTFSGLNGSPRIDTTIDGTDPAVIIPGWIWGGNKPTTDKEDYAQLDIELPVDGGVISAWKAGIKLRDHERAQDRFVYSWHGPNTVADPSSNYLTEFFNQCVNWTSCGLFSGVVSVGEAVLSGNLTQQLVHNRAAMWRIAFDQLPDGTPADYAVSRLLNEVWTVDEEITALYLQADFEGDRYRGNAGVRYVSTDQTSGGFEYTGMEFLTVDRTWLAPDSFAWVTQTNDYSEALPSFNLAIDLTDNQILRFGLARVMSRQNFSDISASVAAGNLNVAVPTGSAGNPQLDPFFANQFDVSWENYYGDASALSVAFFYKDVDSFRSSDTFQRDFFNELTSSDVTVTFTRPINGKGGTISGLEFGLQHDFDNGFGIVANYTYIDAENDEPRDPTIAGSGLVEGVSDTMANLSGYYENDVFSIRASYNHRTEWYKSLHFSGAELWNDDYAQLDLSANWFVNDYLSLTFEAINLTDEEVVEYNTEKARTMSIYQNGLRYLVGARVNF